MSAPYESSNDSSSGFSTNTLTGKNWLSFILVVEDENPVQEEAIAALVDVVTLSEFRLMSPVRDLAFSSTRFTRLRTPSREEDALFWLLALDQASKSRVLELMYKREAVEVVVVNLGGAIIKA